ncbi:MAG: ATP-dependent endonuclease [Methylocystaceae bacterium]|nr:MAG: ATP-dependent endonuclease [Methylocystaceae bacterium]
MRACRLTIKNFRGVKSATLLLPKHGVLIGDNNTGKTTILEALDLVLGPDRLNRQPPIDEHDFFRGIYLLKPAAPPAEAAEAVEGGGEAGPLAEEAAAEPPKIEIEVTVADLTEEQKGKFGNYIEFWDGATDTFYDEPNPAGVDAATITEALRVAFLGWYDAEEDDFEGKTYFARSLTEGDRPEPFSKKHKQVCGFLYLRSLRTGSRALSLERGSLLDIILRLKEVRPQMWEATLGTLAGISVASDPKLGISPVLESINTALKKYVPKEWGVEPHLKVSNLTREHLRKVITAFIATGHGDHAAPFYRQGTGTINMLVLAMLSQIAQDKQNVIFAMEEPETAIPPYAQKRIVHEVRKLASQTLFTSHSPYVLEEFAVEETVVLGRDGEGVLGQKAITLPNNVKLKRYRQQFRTRFCEGLLARRVLVAEGATESSAFPVACRRLAELKPDTYASLEALGVCIVDAGGETDIPGMAKLYRDLGKRAFAICDKQSDPNKALIEAQVELLLMHEEKGFEAMVLKGAMEAALKRFTKVIDWPQDLAQKYPDPEAQAAAALTDYFAKSKGNWGIADFLAQCSEAEIPRWLRDAAVKLKDACLPAPAGGGQAAAPAAAEEHPEAVVDGAD